MATAKTSEPSNQPTEDPYASASEPRRKFFAGELIWQEYVRAEQAAEQSSSSTSSKPSSGTSSSG